MSDSMSGHVSDDFEMSDVKEITDNLSPKSSISPAPASVVGGRLPSSSSTRPPVSGSTTSSRDTDDSVSLAGDVEVITVSSRDNSVEPPVVPIIIKTEHSSQSPLQNTLDNSKPPSAGPSTSASVNPLSNTTAAAVPAKPKSTKAVRPRSPSPSPPPPPPPPLQTIRLDIRLGGPDDYEVDISNMAKETGQRPPTPVRVIKRDISDSEGEDDAEGESKKDGEPSKPASKAKRKKKNLTAEYYDVHDPFIDDSELALDERTYFAQTKQQGFYVSSGEVALLKDKTPKKPKSKRPGPSAKADAAAAAAGPSHPSTFKREGTKDSPIALGSDDEDAKPGQKRKRYTTVVENGKKRRVVNIHDFHPELQQSIDELKHAITKENWDYKGKFPPGIKPLLAQVALKAVALDEYDDHFFNLMPVLFPYNKFTMSKLIKRTIFQDHVQLLNQRQTALLEELGRLTAEGFPRAQEEWEKTVAQWEAKQEKIKAEAKVGGEESAPGAPPPSARQSTEDAASGMEQDQPPLAPTQEGSTPKVAGKTDAHPPSKKYRMTETMKGIVWQLVGLSNECCRLENEKNSLEGSNNQVSEQGLRKSLYQKIVAAFPDGWMSSGQISRDVSSMKKKYEKEAMDNES